MKLNILGLAWLIPLFPVMGFLVVAYMGWKEREGGAPFAIGLVGISMVISLLVCIQAYVGMEPYEASISWAKVGDVDLEMGIYVDALTALMLFVVSVIGFLIVVYSVGYMHKEEGKARYYAEICLFIGVMLGLVLSNNYLQIYIFWELVGLCSYLLIGFWYKKKSAAAAAKKAFLVTRVGDIFFLLGIVVLFSMFNTFNIQEIGHSIAKQHALGILDIRVLTIATLGVFGGAVGKSAQFPLHVWLPDAMEGPTTVSALIHAATMVKAGVYLVARSYPLFVFTPDTFMVVAVIGGFTAFLAASMALVQFDIKRVLAYSTVSQIGYMFLALGVGGYVVAEGHESGGYTAGMFHLLNHACFKALLFLCAGSVIHAVGTNDMRSMGGLGRKMKWTSLFMLIGSLSIAGVPFLSGFFSKDEVIAAVHNATDFSPVFYILLILTYITAFMTAFYMFRMWLMTFTGSPRDTHKFKHAHESPYIMTVPLAILSFFAIFSGYSLFFGKGFAHFIRYPFEAEVESLSIPELFLSPLTWLSIVVAFGGIGLAYAIYYLKSPSSHVFVATSPRRFARKVLVKKYWMDYIYYGFAERVVYVLALVLDVFDRYVIDGAVNGIAKGTVELSRVGRKLQSGLVQHYATVVLGGICILILLLFFMGVKAW